MNVEQGITNAEVLLTSKFLILHSIFDIQFLYDPLAR